jgi:hypothetical protein
MCPHKNKRGGELPTLAPPHEWDLKRWQTLSQRGWERGGQGASPPGRGSWGVSPHKFKRGNEPPTLATPPRVGPKTLADPKPTRVGNGGPGGLEDVPPEKGSELSALAPIRPTSLAHEGTSTNAPTISLTFHARQATISQRLGRRSENSFG